MGDSHYWGDFGLISGLKGWGGCHPPVESHFLAHLCGYGQFSYLCHMSKQGSYLILQIVRLCVIHEKVPAQRKASVEIIIATTSFQKQYSILLPQFAKRQMTQSCPHTGKRAYVAVHDRETNTINTLPTLLFFFNTHCYSSMKPPWRAVLVQCQAS